MVFNGFGDLLHLIDLTANCPVVPVLKPPFAILASGGKVNILQGQLKEISSGRLESVVAEPLYSRPDFMGNTDGSLCFAATGGKAV